MHVHIYCGDGEAKFWLEPHIELANNFHLSRVQLKEIGQIIAEHYVSSEALGANTSPVEVTHISNHGVWLLARSHELFMSYEDFPWFRDVPVGTILNVEEPTPGHFYWPDLDVDLTEEMILHPERFPLTAR